MSPWLWLVFYTTPCSRSRRIWSWPRPASRRTSSVCSPHSGAAARTEAGVRCRCTGWPRCRSFPSGGRLRGGADVVHLRVREHLRHGVHRAGRHAGAVQGSTQCSTGCVGEHGLDLRGQRVAVGEARRLAGETFGVCQSGRPRPRRSGASCRARRARRSGSRPAPGTGPGRHGGRMVVAALLRHVAFVS